MLGVKAKRKSCNRSRDYNARFTATHRTVSVYRVLQMRGGGYADVLPVLQVPNNNADAVPCKRLRKVQLPDSFPVFCKHISREYESKGHIDHNAYCKGPKWFHAEYKQVFNACGKADTEKTEDKAPGA